MKPISDSSTFNWIAEGRQPTPPAYSPEGVPLSCVLPLAFDCYAKILHSFNASEDSTDRSLSKKELEILKIPDCISIKDLVAVTPIGARIHWREAAKALGVPYVSEITHQWFSKALSPDPQCWPRFIDGPADGILQIEECRELASILEKITSSPTCLFRLPEIPFVGTDRGLIFEGLLSEVPKFSSGFQFGPEYWWPPDHEWCVCSDYDLTFTVVGGPPELISSLQKSDVLECMEISPSIRVDSLVPIPR